jgi:hypothetical protein
MIFLRFKNSLAYYCAGVVAVNSKIVGLAPDKKAIYPTTYNAGVVVVNSEVVRLAPGFGCSEMEQTFHLVPTREANKNYSIDPRMQL